MALTAKAILHKVKFVKKRFDGTLRIVRDTYHTAKESWWVIRKRIVERDDHRCRSTLLAPNGKKYRCPNTDQTHTLEVHHIKALSKGGRTTDSNLVTMCSDCHARRHAHL